MGGSVGVFELIQKERARTHTKPKSALQYRMVLYDMRLRLMTCGSSHKVMSLNPTSRGSPWHPSRRHRPVLTTILDALWGRVNDAEHLSS